MSQPAAQRIAETDKRESRSFAYFFCAMHGMAQKKCLEAKKSAWNPAFKQDKPRIALVFHMFSAFQNNGDVLE
jgi:hypothetical protein